MSYDDRSAELLEEMAEMPAHEVEQMMEDAQRVLLAYQGFMQIVAACGYDDGPACCPVMSPHGVSLSLH